MRLAAFEAVKRMAEVRGDLTLQDLAMGFEFQGRRYPLINPQRGIFKPREMRHLLSIRTVWPKKGARVWYDDQRDVHRQLFAAEDVVDYSFMGTNPDAADNRWLREAMADRVPIIYFLGIAPSHYQAIVPTYIVGWDPRALKAQVAFGPEADLDAGPPADVLERRYALRDVKHRLHQSSFREAVIQAYAGQCALSRLKEPILLDAAHIVADGDLMYGQPVVQNGIPLSKLHHAAFDAHLIGIDADYRIHVAHRLLEQRDGPMLEALKRLDAQQILLPRRQKDWPDRDRLAQRYEVFKARS